MKPCLNCQSETVNPKFCSLSCSATYQMQHTIWPIRVKKLKHCEHCKSDFEIKSKAQKFCTRRCARRSGKTGRQPTIFPKPCLQCKVLFQPYQGTRGQKYCSTKCMGEAYKHKTSSDYKSSDALRKYLKRTRAYLCSICGLSEWNSTPITLTIDHIDGNYLNNKELNLRFLCPNCHSQTPTFGAKNKGNGRYLRRLRYSQGKSS